MATACFPGQLLSLVLLRLFFSRCKGVCDGAGAVVIASEEAVKKHSLTPLARIIAYHAVGCDPNVMGIGKLHPFLEG